MTALEQAMEIALKLGNQENNMMEFDACIIGADKILELGLMGYREQLAVCFSILTGFGIKAIDILKYMKNWDDMKVEEE